MSDPDQLTLFDTTLTWSIELSVLDEFGQPGRAFLVMEGPWASEQEAMNHSAQIVKTIYPGCEWSGQWERALTGQRRMYGTHDSKRVVRQVITHEHYSQDGVPL